MLLLDWVLGHSRVIRDQFCLRLEVRSVDAPANSSGDARHFANRVRLVVNTFLLRTHLLTEEASVGGLEGAGVLLVH